MNFVESFLVKDSEKSLDALMDFLSEENKELFLIVEENSSKKEFVSAIRNLISDINLVFSICASGERADLSKFEGNIFAITEKYPFLNRIIYIYLHHIKLEDLNQYIDDEELVVQNKRLNAFFARFE